MRLIESRAAAFVTSLALLAGATGVGSLASLASAATGGPTVSLTSTSASVTNAATIPVTATFSEPVSDFASGDISVTGGAVTSFAASSTASTTVFTFEVDPSADGTVTVSVPADVATSVSTSLGNQASNTLSFTADTTAPSISRTVTLSPTSATIDWTTSEAATGQVNYGLTIDYTGSTTMETTANTSHSATITGLTPSTTYHYEVTATDAAGNTGTTGDLTFTTPEALSCPMTVSNVSSSVTGASTATVTWNTNFPATSQVFYGTTTAYGASTTMSSTATTSHSAMLSGLNPGTLYHFYVSSGNGTCTGTSTDMTFTTNATTTLAITGIDAVSTVATADNVWEHGFKWVIHFTVPDSETQMQLRFNDFTATGGGTIPANGNIRFYSAQSSNASTTASAIVSANNNYGGTMHLTGDTSTSLPGRQVSVVVEVKVPVGTPTGVYSTLFGALTQ